MRPKLLIGPPRPPSRTPLYLALALLWAASVFAAWGWGWQMAYEVTEEERFEAERTLADLETCLAQGDRVARAASHALVEVRSVGQLLEEMEQYRQGMTMPAIVATALD